MEEVWRRLHTFSARNAETLWSLEVLKQGWNSTLRRFFSIWKWNPAFRGSIFLYLFVFYIQNTASNYPFLLFLNGKIMSAFVASRHHSIYVVIFVNIIILKTLWIALSAIGGANCVLQNISNINADYQYVFVVRHVFSYLQVKYFLNKIKCWFHFKVTG